MSSDLLFEFVATQTRQKLKHDETRGKTRHVVGRVMTCCAAVRVELLNPILNLHL